MVHPRTEARKKTGELLGQFKPYMEELEKLHFFELEFESGLKYIQNSGSTGDLGTLKVSTAAGGLKNPIDKQCLEYFKKGELNMKNNLFGVAILNYLKAYEIVKRAGASYSKDMIFETILQIS